MGEIKSTLDLVLEKTRHLSLSSEEKQAQTQISKNASREYCKNIKTGCIRWSSCNGSMTP